MTKVAIRTSDRQQFKRCRISWNYGSPIRHGMKRISGIETRHMDFGSAIHAALDVYHSYERRDDELHFKRGESLVAFNEYMQKWRKQLIASSKFHPAAKVEWDNWVNLGTGMLLGYFPWADEEYKDYEVAYSEIEFEVPIPVPDELVVDIAGISDTLDAVKGKVLKTVDEYKEFWPALEDDTYYLLIFNAETQTWDLVLYQGRIDLILRHKKSGRYWVIDHKSTSKFDNLTDWIDIDIQASAYYWAVSKMLGIDVEGIIFNYLKKTVPEEPKLIKKGTELSQDKSQNTTLARYKAAMQQLGHSPIKYAKFLSEFEDPILFKSHKTYRTPDELKFIEYCIASEAIDMLDNPRIYPHSGQFNCNGCPFKDPCHTKHSGGDDIWWLNESGAYVPNSERAIK